MLREVLLEPVYPQEPVAAYPVPVRLTNDQVLSGCLVTNPDDLSQLAAQASGDAVPADAIGILEPLRGQNSK